MFASCPFLGEEPMAESLLLESHQTVNAILKDSLRVALSVLDAMNKLCQVQAPGD